MKDAVPIIIEQQPNSWHMIRALGGVGIICAVLIVFTYQATLPTIQRKKAIYLQKAVYKVLPGAVAGASFGIDEENRITLLGEGESPARVVYAGYDSSGRLVGIALEAQGQGFQDTIRLLYGYSPDRQSVIGIQVLESKETPGLGDKIEKDPDFLANFKALDVALGPDGALIHTIEPVKKGKKESPWQIDSISGATISSKAVANMLRDHTLRWIPVLARHKSVFEEHAP